MRLSCATKVSIIRNHLFLKKSKYFAKKSCQNSNGLKQMDQMSLLVLKVNSLFTFVALNKVWRQLYEKLVLNSSSMELRTTVLKLQLASLLKDAKFQKMVGKLRH